MHRPHVIQMNLEKVVGLNVKRYREKRGLSQEELADISGLHRTYISGVDRGVRNPTIRIVQILAQALRVKPTDLLTE